MYRANNPTDREKLAPVRADTRINVLKTAHENVQQYRKLKWKTNEYLEIRLEIRMLSDMDEVYYSTGQAARELGITQAKIRTLCETEAIEATCTAGGQWRIAKE